MFLSGVFFGGDLHSAVLFTRMLFQFRAAVFLTRLYRLSGRYVPYVIALNWNAVLGMALMTAPIALAGQGAWGAGVGGPVGLVLAAYVIYVEWFTTRLALRTSGGIAATFVAFDIVASLALDALFDALR